MSGVSAVAIIFQFRLWVCSSNRNTKYCSFSGVVGLFVQEMSVSDGKGVSSNSGEHNGVGCQAFVSTERELTLSSCSHCFNLILSFS